MRSNSLKTFFFLLALTAFFIFIGGLIGGRSGAVIAFAIAIVMNFFSYWFSSSIVLKMYKAQEVTEAEQPQLVGMVRNLASKAGLPMPKVAIVPSAAPNAFATGRNPKHGVVAVTTGIMGMLSKEELEGVIAHELSHIQGRDILISTIAATVAGAVMLLADMARWAAIFGGGGNDNENRGNILVVILVAILAPIGAMLIRMAISRTREYEADANAARITKNPGALASALVKISYGVEKIPSNANPATAHMFIMNPLSGEKVSSLFSTHPAVEDRVKRLKEMDTSSARYVTKKSANAMFK